MSFLLKIACLALLGQLVFSSCCRSPKVEKFDSTQAKIDLGKKLFFDKQLSLDNTISCGSCHLPEKAFTDGQQFGTGIKGQLTTRNVPSLLNSKFLKKVMLDGAIENLEFQILVPLTEHNEMGSNMRDLMLELSKDKEYQKLSMKIFKRKFDAYVLTRSIAAYERSLVAMNSRYDQYMYGNKTALNKNEIEGMKLFNSLYCVNCHSEPYFTNFKPENNGLYAVAKDEGRYRVTGLQSDLGKFKTPSLRNVGVTAPYMHDGSFKTLEEVVAHYLKGGNHHINQSKAIKPLKMSNEDRRNLVLFLKALTDKGAF